MFRSPASLAANVAAIGRFSRGPIVIPGDLLQGGEDYAHAVIDEIAATGVDYLAVGALTHSAPVLDVGLDFAADDQGG